MRNSATHERGAESGSASGTPPRKTRCHDRSERDSRSPTPEFSTPPPRRQSETEAHSQQPATPSLPAEAFTPKALRRLLAITS